MRRKIYIIKKKPDKGSEKPENRFSAIDSESDRKEEDQNQEAVLKRQAEENEKKETEEKLRKEKEDKFQKEKEVRVKKEKEDKERRDLEDRERLEKEKKVKGTKS